MENKFIIVGLDDWEGLYYRGNLISDDHEIRRENLIRFMKLYRVLDVEFEYLNQEGERIVQESGSMFNTYEEAKQYLDS
ncbi:MAG: hypothetical protein ACQEXX_01530 [Bacillota bacterium]